MTLIYVLVILLTINVLYTGLNIYKREDTPTIVFGVVYGIIVMLILLIFGILIIN